MTKERPIPPQQGDEYELFERYDHRLRAATEKLGFISQENIEDACAFAWMQMLRYQPYRDSLLPWLITVSRHEAYRLHQHERGHRYETVEGYEPGIPDPRDSIGAAHEVLDGRDRLARLPARSRLALFLRGAGFTHAEVGQTLGVSKTRAHELGARAHHILRNADRDRAEEATDVPERLKLLNEIRRDPPVFILREIGRCPVASRKGGGEEQRLQWSRLVLRVIDHRAERGIDDPFHALGRDLPRRDDTERAALQRDLGSFAAARHRRASDRGLGR